LYSFIKQYRTGGDPNDMMAQLLESQKREQQRKTVITTKSPSNDLLDIKDEKRCESSEQAAQEAINSIDLAGN
jgi:hypothetical protein